MKHALASCCAAVLVLGAVVVVAASPVSAQSGPVGSLDAVSERPGSWVLYGWLWDPTETKPLVSAEVNGEPDGYTFNIFMPRPDVPAAFPGAPENTGFALTLDRPLEGTVCVYSLSSTLQKTANLGCKPIPPGFEGSPTGALDEITPDVGRMTVSGWYADPDASPDERASRENRVQVYLDGRVFAWLRTEVARPDVEAAVPFAGSDSGYWAVLPSRPGPHSVCVYGLNEGPTGRNVTFGCRDIVVPASKGSPLPFGFVDGEFIAHAWGSADNDLGLTGWAAAPDQADVAIRVIALGGVSGFGEGQFDVTGSTGEERPDVAAAVPGTGPDTGFHVIAGAGHVFQYTLACAVGQVVATGAEAVIGCLSNEGF